MPGGVAGAQSTMIAPYADSSVTCAFAQESQLPNSFYLN
jgi:hypothetical protein